MHPIAMDDPSETALPHAGENLLINKMTGQRCAAAPTGSLLLRCESRPREQLTDYNSEQASLNGKRGRRGCSTLRSP
jgi:hypothetical protein